MERYENPFLLSRWRNLRGPALCSQGTRILLGDLYVVVHGVLHVPVCEGRSVAFGPYGMSHCERGHARTFSMQSD